MLRGKCHSIISSDMNHVVNYSEGEYDLTNTAK